MRHHHNSHDRFVDGLILGALMSGKEPSGDTAFWISVLLLCGSVEFVFDHIGLLFILGILGIVVGAGIAALVICYKITAAVCIAIRDFVASLPRLWDDYLNEPPW